VIQRNQHYVCGFLFSADPPGHSRVLLIRKNRPAWQQGKLNGVGGKIEPTDASPLAAMRREFREEAGLDIAEWEEILTLTAKDWHTHFYRAFGEIDAARAMTDERLEIHPTSALLADTIPNLHWIIPLMLDAEILAGNYRVSIPPVI